MKPYTTFLIALGVLLPVASVAETVSASAAVSGEPDLRPLSHRSSFELHLALHQNAPNGIRINGRGIASASSWEQVSFGLGISHWLKDDLALTFAATAQAGELELAWDAERGEFVESRGVVSLLVGVRKYLGGTPRIRPYLAAAAGPYIGGTSVTANRTASRAWTESRAQVTVGGRVGGGVAFRVSRSWIVDLSGGYNLMSDFSRTVGGRHNYNGFELGVGVSWLFGGGGNSPSE